MRYGGGASVDSLFRGDASNLPDREEQHSEPGLTTMAKRQTVAYEFGHDLANQYTLLSGGFFVAVGTSFSGCGLFSPKLNMTWAN